jgi:hypothetical protein
VLSQGGGDCPIKIKQGIRRKKAILLLTLLTAFDARSQAVLGPRPTALQPTLVITSQFATNIFPAELASRLVNLQTELEQLLPLLAAFNDSFDFISVGPPGVPVTTAVPSTVSGPAVNLGADLSQNLSTVTAVNLGQNLSTSLAVPTSSPLALTPPEGVVAESANTGVAVINPGVGLVPILSGPSGAVGFNSARDALRALLILQNDVERMLPIVATVNFSTNNIAAFQTGTPPTGTRATALNPIGR